MKNQIPQLRFPEFKNPLEVLKMEDVVTFKSGGTPSKENESFWNGDIPWISATSMQGKYYSNSERTLTEAGLKNGSKLAIKGTLLLLVRGSMLFNKIPVGITARDVAFNQDLKSLIVNEKSNSEYLYQWFSSKENLILSKVVGTGIGAGKLDTEELNNLDLNIPSLPEQTKIATFLTAVDEKLTALKQKKTLLAKYKKGAMQKIFSQELRFKDDNGNDFADWEERKLGEICEIVMGQSPDSNSYNSDAVGIPLIQGNADIQDRLTNPRNHTTKPTKKCEVGDLILTVRAPVGAVAKSIHDACIGRGVCSIKNKLNSNIEFIFQFLLDYESKWGNLEQGSTFTAVSGIEIKKLRINLPCLEEQIKIANFLSAIDDKINHCNNEIVQTETWKKGLLQQLFV